MKTLNNLIESTIKQNAEPRNGNAYGMLLNEKQLAAVLGQTEYAVRQLRLKHGLPCIPNKGQHQIFYYWPTVDEYFKKKSKPFDTETEQPVIATNEVTAKICIPPELPEPVPSKQRRYKPMEPV